ncbi:hypothetical protein FJT64_006507 [Amphibalanus amphitrite]|uniref:Uncharacterized protein n=1 Tax=Amphibalanus amphitrite TaxID=1232801 RepID=A0A6A4VQV8_AMPAM|nr:hypothetical protein FJT64_006507 [Amphibalanus amphitrite]
MDFQLPSAPSQENLPPPPTSMESGVADEPWDNNQSSSAPGGEPQDPTQPPETVTQELKEENDTHQSGSRTSPSSGTGDGGQGAAHPVSDEKPAGQAGELTPLGRAIPWPIPSRELAEQPPALREAEERLRASSRARLATQLELAKVRKELWQSIIREERSYRKLQRAWEEFLRFLESDLSADPQDDDDL